MPSAPLELPHLHLWFKYRPRSQRIPATACAKLPARKTLKSGGSDPIVPQNRGPIPSGFGGHSRLLLLESAARVLAAQDEGVGEVVRQDVRQNCKGGAK